jgi:oligopeptide/dipeptide ABC transporter ATP-binding protein
MRSEKLLDLKNLKTYFYIEDGVVKAVDGVDFEIYPGETLGIVGESGCGKSVTSLSIMRLIPEPPGKIVDGEIIFNGKDLTKLSQSEMRKIRGNDISMIFQEPMTSLNPVYTIGDQISEAIILHKRVSKSEAMRQSIEMLKKVGISLPEQRVHEYPHQLSGGMRQRVMIAMALSCDPQLLIADEPTTALDVTIQAQILELMNSLKDKFNMSIMMITHDLGVIAEIADRVAVMYAGKIVEYTDVKTLFANPKHPYTWGLMNSIPRMDKEVEKLEVIPGIVPSPLNFPEGCKYHTRCPLADEKCRREEPEILEVEEGHQVRCWHYQELEELKKRAESA